LAYSKKDNNVVDNIITLRITTIFGCCCKKKVETLQFPQVPSILQVNKEIGSSDKKAVLSLLTNTGFISSLSFLIFAINTPETINTSRRKTTQNKAVTSLYIARNEKKAKNLSARGSMYRPNRDCKLNFLAKAPSSQSVKPAIQKRKRATT
jgi:hypothetical protein